MCFRQSELLAFTHHSYHSGCLRCALDRCRSVEEEGNDDVDDGDVVAAAVDDDDGFSFDIAQSEALASPHTLIHVGTFRMRNSTESRQALSIRVRIKMEEMKVYVRV